MFSCLVELVFSDSLYFGEFSKNSFVYFSVLTSVCPLKKHASWGFYSHCVKLQNNLEKTTYSESSVFRILLQMYINFELLRIYPTDVVHMYEML